MFENNFPSSGNKTEVLDLQHYRAAFASLATPQELEQFDQQLAAGEKVGPLTLLRRYADKLEL